MSRKKLMTTIAYVAAALFLLGDCAIPTVRAASYQVEQVEQGSTVLNPGDVLMAPEWADQGMLIRFMDENGESIRNVNVGMGQNFTIPPYDGNMFWIPIPEGMIFDGWKVTAKPTEQPMVVQWELTRCLKADGSAGDEDVSGGDTDPDEGNKPGGDTDPDEGSKPGEDTNPDEGSKPGEDTNPDEGSKPEGNTFIDEAGTYELRAGVVYTLGAGITHVKGDRTIYASPVEFTVDEDGEYTFYRSYFPFQ